MFIYPPLLSVILSAIYFTFIPTYLKTILYLKLSNQIYFVNKYYAILKRIAYPFVEVFSDSSRDSIYIIYILNKKYIKNCEKGGFLLYFLTLFYN